MSPQTLNAAPALAEQVAALPSRYRAGLLSCLAQARALAHEGLTQKDRSRGYEIMLAAGAALEFSPEQISGYFGSGIAP